MKTKKGDIGYSYIIMIVLGIIGAIFVLWIYTGGFSQLGGKALGFLNQTAP